MASPTNDMQKRLKYSQPDWRVQQRDAAGGGVHHLKKVVPAMSFGSIPQQLALVHFCIAHFHAHGGTHRWPPRMPKTSATQLPPMRRLQVGTSNVSLVVYWSWSSSVLLYQVSGIN